MVDKKRLREEPEPVIELPGSRFADHAQASLREETKTNEFTVPNAVKMTVQTQKHVKNPVL